MYLYFRNYYFRNGDIIYKKKINQMNNSNIYRWVKASEFKFQENTLYFAENREPGLEYYKIAVEYVHRMSTNGKEYLKNGKELFWKHLNDWKNLYIMEELPSETKEVKESAMDEQWIIDQINTSYNEHTGTNEGVQDAAYYIAAKHKEILAQFNQSVPVSRWISVVSKPEKDLNPAYSVEVLVSVDKLYAGRLPLYGIGQYDFEHDCWLHLTFEPSHWMPLPQKP